jgi:hypothetical protein
MTGKELHAFRGHAARIMGLSFSPDGRRLASASEDHTALVWDSTRYLPQRHAGERLSQAELDRLWSELASEDAARAYQAMGTLRSRPEQAIAFLKEQLHPPAPPSDEQIAGWVSALNSEQFAEREQASAALAKLGSAAETALRKALDARPGPEARRRIEKLLERLRGTPPEQLRPLRSLEVLEGIGTAAAQVALEELARAAPERWLVREAQSTLHRLTQRHESPATRPVSARDLISGFTKSVVSCTHLG